MDTSTPTFAIIVPTLNAGPLWNNWLEALSHQAKQPSRRLLVDSGSTDDTVRLAEIHGFEIARIDRSAFDHGGTRQAMAEIASNVEILVYLTQDAILANPDSLRVLINAFIDRRTAVCYGRQLPHRNADAIEAHARLYNYPPRSEVRDSGDIARLGLKAAFCSNSFAAYRRSILSELGGFPTNQIMMEDSIVAARALLAGWQVAYVSDACVFHSHDYSATEEFQRYFDIGASHALNKETLMSCRGTSREGLRYVKSELRYLRKNRRSSIPRAVLRTALKYLAYRLGQAHKLLPLPLTERLSMHKYYWKRLRSEP